jgi:hypothetical protein
LLLIKPCQLVFDSIHCNLLALAKRLEKSKKEYSRGAQKNRVLQTNPTPTYFFSSELHSKTIDNVMIAVKLGVAGPTAAVAARLLEEVAKKLILLPC